MTLGLGGAFGLLWARRLANVLGPMLPTAAPSEIGSRAFAFVWLLLLTTSAIVGLVSPLYIAPADRLSGLRNRATEMDWHRVSWQHALVVAQLALCLTALVVAGM